MRSAGSEGEDRIRYERIRVIAEEGILVVTLNRPQRLNGWTARMGWEISHAPRAADADDGTRIVVLTGTGRAFCAGADPERAGSTFDSSSGDPEEVSPEFPSD